MRSARIATSRVALGLLALSVFLLIPRGARAQNTRVPRVLVLTFTGWHAAQARQLLAEEIAPFVELVDEQRAVEAAASLGVDLGSAEGFAQVVDYLEITLIIAGAVEGRGQRASIEFSVVTPTGEELATGSGPSPSSANRAGIGQAAIDALEAARAAQNGPSEPPPEETEPDESESYGDEQDLEIPDEPAADSPPIAWPQPVLTVLGGLRIRSVATRVANEGGGNDFVFVADPYPEIELVAQIRPLAGAADLSRGLILGLQGSFSAGISYLGADGAARGMTSASFRFDVGYGYVIADLFELIGRVGFGIDGVLLDDPDGFPSTLYSYIRPAVEGRVRAYEDLFVIEFGFGGRIGADGGDIAGAYGPGLFFGGIDLFAGFGGRVDPGFAWAARFGYVTHVLNFEGAGGSFGDGLGGTDEAFEGHLLVGAAL